jgi:hypothetical protein
LDELQIVSGSELHMILRLRGGMFHPVSSRKDYDKLSYELVQKINEAHRMINTMKEYYSSLQLVITVFDDLQKELMKCEEDHILKLCELIKKYYVE